MASDRPTLPPGANHLELVQQERALQRENDLRDLQELGLDEVVSRILKEHEEEAAALSPKSRVNFLGVPPVPEGDPEEPEWGAAR